MTARSRTNASWIVLGVVVVGLLTWAVWPSGARSDAERVHDLAAELRCPDCESLSAADSQTESARAIRRDLRERVAEGESDPTIRQAYVDRYGDTILLKPSSDGLGLLVWGLPVAVVIIGGGVLALTLHRWRSAERRPASAADAALVEQARGQNPADDSAS